MTKSLEKILDASRLMSKVVASTEAHIQIDKNYIGVLLLELILDDPTSERQLCRFKAGSNAGF